MAQVFIKPEDKKVKNKMERQPVKFKARQPALGLRGGL